MVIGYESHFHYIEQLCLNHCDNMHMYIIISKVLECVFNLVIKMLIVKNKVFDLYNFTTKKIELLEIKALSYMIQQTKVSDIL